jgi:hypothetical protein
MKTWRESASIFSLGALPPSYQAMCSHVSLAVRAVSFSQVDDSGDVKSTADTNYTPANPASTPSSATRTTELGTRDSSPRAAPSKPMSKVVHKDLPPVKSAK